MQLGLDPLISSGKSVVGSYFEMQACGTAPGACLSLVVNNSKADRFQASMHVGSWLVKGQRSETLT